MKANEVLRLLQISRPTLHRWRKAGILKATKLSNGQYNWDEESVFTLLNKGEKRGVYLYARVSTPKQKQDLENQLEALQNFSLKQGYQVKGAFKDIASGISFEKRKEFFKLLDLVIAGKVSKVIITYKDRLSRVGFDLFKYLFEKYHTEIIVMSELHDKKTDQQEIFEEIVSLLHAFSMRMYSGRRKRIKEALEQEEKAGDHDGETAQVEEKTSSDV